MIVKERMNLDKAVSGVLGDSDEISDMQKEQLQHAISSHSFGLKSIAIFKISAYGKWGTSFPSYDNASFVFPYGAKSEFGATSGYTLGKWAILKQEEDLVSERVIRRGYSIGLVLVLISWSLFVWMSLINIRRSRDYMFRKLITYLPPLLFGLIFMYFVYLRITQFIN